MTTTTRDADSGDSGLAIPTIRLDVGQASQAETARALNQACCETGFFYLVGHGLSDKLLEGVFQQSKTLFALETASKRRLTDPVLSRGYTALYEETLDPATQKQLGDTKEGYYIGRHVDADSPAYNPSKLQGPNVWPTRETAPDMADPEEFKRVMQDYFDTISQVALQVVRLLAVSLDLPADYFDADFQEPMAALRLLHYDAQPSRPDEGILGCGAHSDYGMITLLLTDEHEGLQILDKHTKNWIAVPPVKGALIVNLGDMLERWTNGLYQSTVHRVVLPDKHSGDRYSMPFFFEPAFDTRVACLPSCCSAEHPAKYLVTTSGEYLLSKYKATHADFAPKE